MQPAQRNRGTEIIVAIVAFSAIVLSVIFAIVLTLDSFRSSTPTPAANAGLATATEAVVTQQSNTDPATDTATPAPTDTESPTETVEASPTEAASDTPRATQTRVTSTPSPTRTPTESDKPQGRVTEAPTDAPTDTPRPTRTRITSTPSPTRTATATATLTDTATVTRTATATRTSTVTRTATETAPASPTRTPSPTATPTLTRTVVLATPVTEIAPTATAADVAACTPPAGWQPYVVQSGQNLFRIALAVGLPLSELQQANCISNASSIIAGQVIYIPPSGVGGLQTAVAQTQQAPPAQPGTGTTPQVPAVEGCTLPYVTISTPQHGAVMPLGQLFVVRGTATLPDTALFSFYKVEVRAAGSSVWNNVTQPTAPVPGPAGQLAVINPDLFGAGVYQIALTVVDTSAGYPQPCIISVVFR